jgi:hypothetical protein
MSSRFKPKRKPKLMNPQLSERLKRTFRAYEDIDRQYVPDRKNNKNELETSFLLDFLAFEDENGYRVDVLNPGPNPITIEATALCTKLVDVP